MEVQHKLILWGLKSDFNTKAGIIGGTAVFCTSIFIYLLFLQNTIKCFYRLFYENRILSKKQRHRDSAELWRKTKALFSELV